MNSGAEEYAKYHANCKRHNTKFKKLCTGNNLNMAHIVKFYFKHSDIFNSTKIDIAIDACKNGNIELAKWIYPLVFNYEYDLEMQQKMLSVACDNNQLAIIQWLFQVLPENPVRPMTYFTRCCRKGIIDIAKWLLERYPAIDCAASDNAIFRNACECGYIEIIRLIYSIKPINSDELTMIFIQLGLINKKTLSVPVFSWLYDNTVATNKFNYNLLKFSQKMLTEKCLLDNFFYACGNGLIDIAKWLLATFPIISDKGYKSIYAACVNGHLEMAKWIGTEWPLIRLGYSYTLSHTIQNNHLEVAKWIKSQWKKPWISLDTLCIVIDYGYLEMAQWVCSEWTNCTTPSDSEFRTCCKHGRLELAQWLIKTWPDIYNKCTDVSSLFIAHERGHTELVEWILSLYKHEDLCELINNCYRYNCSNLVWEIIDKFGIDHMTVEKKYQKRFNTQLDTLKKHSLVKSSKNV